MIPALWFLAGVVLGFLLAAAVQWCLLRLGSRVILPVLAVMAKQAAERIVAERGGMPKWPRGGEGAVQ